MAKKEITATTEETVERNYTLRRLKDKDLFPILDILAKVLPDDLTVLLASAARKGKKLDDIGAAVTLKLITAVCKNINKVHDEVYELLSDVSGIPAKEIEDMEFGTTPMMIWDIVKNEKNAGFFSVLSKLL